MSLSGDKIEVWIRARDARRFQAEMARSAASVREVGAAATESSKKMGAMSRASMILRKSLKWGALAVVAIGAEATKMGVQFDSAMERIHTQSGETQKGVRLLRKEVLNLASSGKVQQGPQELANALYRLEGAGIRGAKAMRALKAAADLAAVGNANVEDTAKTMAQTMFVGMKGTGNMRQLVGELNATVGAGDLKLQNLVDALGTGVTASAKQAGLSFHDVTGALAVFGDETNNVSGWSAQFATALHFLYAPTDKAKKALHALGLGSNRLAKDMSKHNGLVRSLADLRSHLDKLPGGAHGVKGRQLMADILPGGRGRVLLVLLNQLDRLRGKLKQIHDTARGTGAQITKVPGRALRTTDVRPAASGGFEEAVRKTQQQPLFKLRAAWTQVEAAMIHFYDAIKKYVIPALVGIMGVFAKVIVWLTHIGDHVHAVIQFWKGLPGPIKLAAEAIGIIIAQVMLFKGAMLVFGLVTKAINAVKFAVFALRYALMVLASTNPIVLGLMALVTVAVLIATHWKAFKKIMGAVWDWLKGAARALGHFIASAARKGFLGPLGLIISRWGQVKKILSGIWNGIKGAASSAWNWIKRTVSGATTATTTWITNHWNTLLGFFRRLPGRMANIFSGMWDGIKTAFKTAINWVLSAWNALHFRIGGWHVGPVHLPHVTVGLPHIPLLAQGGTMPIGGMGIVGDAGPELASVGPRGTKITPLSRGGGGAGLAGAFQFHFEVPVIVHGREIARATADEVSDWSARRGR